jgi:hypothetical protein
MTWRLATTKKRIERAISRSEGGSATLWSRHGTNFTDKLPKIAEAIATNPRPGGKLRSVVHRIALHLARLKPGLVPGFLCVPSMIDSLEVEVLCPA